MKMFNGRGGHKTSSEKSMDGYYGGAHKNMPSHKPVKGAPKPGHATSSMQKEIGGSNKDEPGAKKYGSNQMSPGCIEGKVNEYGK
jgi:hypothetical protein